MFSRLYKYKELYGELSTVFVPMTTLLGFFTGIISLSSDKNVSPNFVFTNMIGYTSIGMITGITYPISYPLLAGYVLYNNSKKIT